MPPPRPWIVLPHDPWERLTDNVWSVSAALPDMPLCRWMTALKVGDGRVVMKTMGSTGGPRITGLVSFFGVSDRKALSAHYRQLAATPHLAFAVPGHGAVIDGDVCASLTQVSAG